MGFNKLFSIFILISLVFFNPLFSNIREFSNEKGIEEIIQQEEYDLFDNGIIDYSKTRYMIDTIENLFIGRNIFMRRIYEGSATIKFESEFGPMDPNLEFIDENQISLKYNNVEIREIINTLNRIKDIDFSCYEEENDEENLLFSLNTYEISKQEFKQQTQELKEKVNFVLNDLTNTNLNGEIEINYLKAKRIYENLFEINIYLKNIKTHEIIKLYDKCSNINLEDIVISEFKSIDELYDDFGIKESLRRPSITGRNLELIEEKNIDVNFIRYIIYYDYFYEVIESELDHLYSFDYAIDYDPYKFDLIIQDSFIENFEERDIFLYLNNENTEKVNQKIIYTKTSDDETFVYIVEDFKKQEPNNILTNLEKSEISIFKETRIAPIPVVDYMQEPSITEFYDQLVNGFYLILRDILDSHFLASTIIFCITLSILIVLIHVFIFIYCYAISSKKNNLKEELIKNLGADKKENILYLGGGFVLLIAGLVLAMDVENEINETQMNLAVFLLSLISDFIKLIPFILLTLSSILITIYVIDSIKYLLFKQKFELTEKEKKKMQNEEKIEILKNLKARLTEVVTELKEKEFQIDLSILKMIDEDLEIKKVEFEKMKIKQAKEEIEALSLKYEKTLEKLKEKLDIIIQNEERWSDSILEKIQKTNYVNEDMLNDIPREWRIWAMKREVIKNPNSFLVYKNGSLTRMKLQTIKEGDSLFLNILKENLRKLGIDSLIVLENDDVEPTISIIPKYVKNALYKFLSKEAMNILEGVAVNNFFTNFDMQISFSNEKAFVKKNYKTSKVFILFDSNLDDETIIKNTKEVIEILSKIY